MKIQAGSFLTLLCVGLLGCAGENIDGAEPYITDQDDRIRQKSGTIHGNPKGFVLFSDREDQDPDQPEANGGDRTEATNRISIVNPFLWQASLESLDFMPLAQADSNGGVIITDWYAPSETPEERFKVTVYILDPELRADALKVNVFRQVDGAKGWADAPVDGETAKGLEDNILTRARELRLTTTGEASTS